MAEKVPEATREKIQELQLLQQRLTVFTAQKQQLQIQLAELDNALAELQKAKPPVYRLLGEILVEKLPDELKAELKEKRDEIDLRIKTIEKQESKTREKAQELQKAIAELLK
ncbi:MAG: prefoldin subunit beta [Candidatus Nanoarchaeia archaeon]